MKVYWRHRRRGQNLVLGDDNEDNEQEIGGFRENKRSIDAYAKTFSYDPGRSQKGFPTIEDAKSFVEDFKPWELFDGTQDLTVESEVRPALDSSTPAAPSAPEQPLEMIGAADQPVESVAPESMPEAVSPEPEPESVAPESMPEAVSPEPEPESVAPESMPEAVSPEPEPESVAPESTPEAVSPEPAPESVAPETQQKKSWWEFWKNG